MAFKSYSLVAWTEEGKVRMVPSLVNEMKVPYEEKIARLESREYDDELEWLLDRSRAWEEYAEFFLDLGYFRQAYRCYENAALSTTPGSDLLWVQDLDSERPVMPLYYRFLAMHGKCRELIGQHPGLQEEYSAGRLERSYLFYTQDERREWREMQESCQSMKAWSFGKSPQ